MNIPILFEDNFVLVINKPSGVVVNRAETVKEETVQDWSETKLGLESGESGSEFYKRAGIVHRLDKDTSGILLIAKNPEAFEILQKQFAERIIKKTYQTLVTGRLPSRDGEIRLPVGRIPHGHGTFGIIPYGKESVTKYIVLTIYDSPYGIYSLLEVYPETGRTHQIRVHLKHLGSPVVGDILYGGRAMLKAAEQFCPRLFLHAFRITFLHPEMGKEMTIECPLPEELEKVLKRLS